MRKSERDAKAKEAAELQARSDRLQAEVDAQDRRVTRAVNYWIAAQPWALRMAHGVKARDAARDACNNHECGSDRVTVRWDTIDGNDQTHRIAPDGAADVVPTIAVEGAICTEVTFDDGTPVLYYDVTATCTCGWPLFWRLPGRDLQFADLMYDLLAVPTDYLNRPSIPGGTPT